MRVLDAVVEIDTDFNLYVGHVPGILGADSQGKTLEELYENLYEVLTEILDEAFVLRLDPIG